MSDRTQGSTERVPRPIPAFNQPCEHLMRGHGTWHKRGYLRYPTTKWSAPCPNRATGNVGDKWVCAAHGGPKR